MLYHQCSGTFAMYDIIYYKHPCSRTTTGASRKLSGTDQRYTSPKVESVHENYWDWFSDWSIWFKTKWKFLHHKKLCSGMHRYNGSGLHRWLQGPMCLGHSCPNVALSFITQVILRDQINDHGWHRLGPAGAQSAENSQDEDPQKILRILKKSEDEDPQKKSENSPGNPPTPPTVRGSASEKTLQSDRGKKWWEQTARAREREAEKRRQQGERAREQGGSDRKKGRNGTKESGQ